MIALGVFLHAIGGFAAGSLYIPFKKVRNWAWESYWLVDGVFSWILMPWLVALLVVPQLPSLLADAPRDSVLWSYVFGVLWGIGGLTFGLSMRYLGMSLGYAIALGFCAAVGTLTPPIQRGVFAEFMSHASGRTILAGVGVCLAGIAVCGWAAVRAQVRRNINIFKPGGGYVFNSIHNIQPGVPPENIVALFDAAYEYGFYEH